MNKFEELLDEAEDAGVTVHENFPLEGKESGLYVDKNVALSDQLQTTIEKSCVLAEELGHHHTTVGNIIDQSDARNRKQERQARLYGFNRLIGLQGLIRAIEHGCGSLYEIAEYLEVTDEYLHKCLECYRDKYGEGTVVDNYVIHFIPALRAGKML